MMAALTITAWAASLNQLATCLSNMGKHDEARSWFERAATEAEKGDVHGRINHEELSKDLHQVGWCLSQTGKHTEAQLWFERAVKETEKGDVHGRVDVGSLGGQACIRWALVWARGPGTTLKPKSGIERAVEAKRKGDMFGKVDCVSLARC